MVVATGVLVSPYLQFQEAQHRERNSVCFGESKGKELESLPGNLENSFGSYPGLPRQYLYNSAKKCSIIVLGAQLPFRMSGKPYEEGLSTNKSRL